MSARTECSTSGPASALLQSPHLSYAADHNVDVDVSRMVMPIRVSADDGGVTGEVFFAEFQAKCLCFFHGQAVVGCISGVEADDILMALNIIALGVR